MTKGDRYIIIEALISYNQIREKEIAINHTYSYEEKQNRIAENGDLIQDVIDRLLIDIAD